MVLQSDPTQKGSGPWLSGAKGKYPVRTNSRAQVNGENTQCSQVLRSLSQENHKFKVSRLPGKVQNNLGSYNNKVECGESTRSSLCWRC